MDILPKAWPLLLNVPAEVRLYPLVFPPQLEVFGRDAASHSSIRFGLYKFELVPTSDRFFHGEKANGRTVVLVFGALLDSAPVFDLKAFFKAPERNRNGRIQRYDRSHVFGLALVVFLPIRLADAGLAEHDYPWHSA